MSRGDRSNSGESSRTVTDDPDEQLHHQVRKIAIDLDHAGQRVDNFLFALAPGVPKGHIHRIIRTGQVRVNGGRIKATYRLQAEDLIRVPPMTVREPGQIKVPRALVDRLAHNILFENDRLLVINKPEGLAVQRGSGLHFGLIDALRQGQRDGILGSTLAGAGVVNEAPRLELVHRLDRGTSGCLVIGKGLGSTRFLQGLFREKQVSKCYLALVSGRWEADLTVNLPLASNRVAGGERVVKACASGKSATSHFSVLRRFSKATLMQVRIETGRTHQIRVHAASQGHAIVGDQKYGGTVENSEFRRLGLKRLYLHASQIAFVDELPISVDSLPDAQWVTDLDRLAEA